MIPVTAVHVRSGLLVGFLVLLSLFQCIQDIIGYLFIRTLQVIILLHVVDYVWRRRYALLEPLCAKYPPIKDFVHKQLESRDGNIRQTDGFRLGFQVPTPKKASEAPKRPVVLITGGAMGLGRIMAGRFAALGYNLILWDINADALSTAAAELKPKDSSKEDRTVTTAVVDVTDETAVTDTIATLKEDQKSVDLLILNAGIVNGQPIEKTSAKSVERLFGVNVFHLFHLTRALLPFMKEEGWSPSSPNPRRRIVVIGSVAGYAGAGALADYCGSKAAANIFAESLSAEVRGSNVAVTLVNPYVIDTGMFRGMTQMRLFSMLKPDHVVDCIMDGIRNGNNLVVVPWFFFYSIQLMKILLPWSALPYIDKVLGASSAMNTFQGSDSAKALSQQSKKEE